MNVQSVQALSNGIAAWGEGERRSRDEKLRLEMLKRQIDQDRLAEQDRAFDRQMKTKQIELAERGEKRARDKMLDENARGAVAAVQAQIDALQKRNESAARIKLIDAQAAAVKEKPASPVAAQLAGIDDYADNFAAALQENNAAMAEAAQLGTTTPRVLKAQIRLSALQQVAAGWQKNAQKEPTVDLELPGEDGVSKMKFRVPQSQWNTSHPMWNRFMTSAQPAAPAANPTQPAAAAPAGNFAAYEGKTITGPDGRRYVVRNGQPTPLAQ